MATNKEQEAFGLVVQHHENGASENDIRFAFQRFMETAGLAAASDMSTEAPPGVGNPGRMDLYVHNTCIEFKTHILNNGIANPSYVGQLDGYLENLLKAGTGVRNGILTDGVHYFQRRVGQEKLPSQPHRDLRTFGRAEQAHHLREYLHGIISAPAENIAPTAQHLKQHFGDDSDLFLAANLLLQESYEAHRNDPTVEVKRRLWQDLLQVALGNDAATAGDESDWLFIRHTYITSLIAVIMHKRLLGEVALHASKRPDALLKGQILAVESELHGVIDADLFTWPTEVGESAYLREIARVVEQFDWTQNPTEVAPTLYQNVISQDERKNLGEYYTPRWLAREITETVVDDPLNQRVLDPSCGSGTFIETVVERILGHAAGLSATDTLRKLQENVVGIDIHPVAVQLAKATWVMAAADTIRAAREDDPNSGIVSAPIYLGDSMQLRYDTGTLAASQSIELETRETLPGQTSQVIFSIPKELARQQSDMDQLISEMATVIDEGGSGEQVIAGYQMSDECREKMKVVATLMGELHAAGRNHVWAYYIRNMIRPAVIAEEKVDRIIGNPPWLTYADSADIIREELPAMSQERFQIWGGGKVSRSQNIATLFYIRCAELYGNLDAVIGMVLPHSALRSLPHLKWRSGNYKRKGGRNAPSIGLNLRVHEPWDLDNVVPHLFHDAKMPASVVFAQFNGAGQGTSLAPGTVQLWCGNWQDNYAGITRNSEPLHHDDGDFKSPYAAASSQGPTIVDRRLFFVEKVPHTGMLPAANTTNVKPRQGNQDNYKYEGKLHHLEGVVSNDHLFKVYLGECLAPYVALKPLRAVLPVSRSSMTMPLIHDDCEDDKHNACRLDIAALHHSVRQRWNSAAEMYREVHQAQTIKDLYDRLNYQKILTSQLETLQDAIANGTTTRLAYTQSGQPTAAIVRDNRAIVDRKLYQTICTSEDEASYLMAILNSDELAARAKPFCTTNWAKKIRDFEKHGWKLPIPRYDAANQLHTQLSQLGVTAERECRRRVEQSDIMDKAPGKAQSDAARKLLRHQWQPNSSTAQAIEAAVAQLLSDPAQATLAARQMAGE